MNFPGDTDRHAIVGATGSGKTQYAVWNLSLKDYTEKPWIVYNFKGDELIDAIPYAHHIDVKDVPRHEHPGIYIVHPHPHEFDEVEAQMWEVWRRGNMGIYVDEGLMIGQNNRAYRSILTQGRSKRIPMMNLSQRPVFLDKFVFTESQFFSVFQLQWEGDMKKMREYVPFNIKNELPRFHSYYYDVKNRELHKLAPVPEANEILRTFARRLEHLKKVI